MMITPYTHDREARKCGTDVPSKPTDEFVRQAFANGAGLLWPDGRDPGWHVTFDRWLKAREAAARREALLEAAQWFAHEDIDAFGASRESAQTYAVLVLADEAQRPGGPRFALAEPERDEEGGR